MRTLLSSNGANGVQQFWDAYATASRHGEPNFRVWAFGDSRELANQLAALVLAGTKRGTTSLLHTFHASGESIPEPGDFSIVVDGDGVPCCIVRTVRVEINPMVDVDARFAWEEGEGDRASPGGCPRTLDTLNGKALAKVSRSTIAPKSSSYGSKLSGRPSLRTHHVDSNMLRSSMRGGIAVL